MFKKIPVAVAALTYVSEAEALRINALVDAEQEQQQQEGVMVSAEAGHHHKKHHKKEKKHHKKHHKKANKQSDDIDGAFEAMVQEGADSIPACNSLGCKKGTAEDTGEAYLAQRNGTANATATSVPACNSLGCKTDSAADSGKQWIAQGNATAATASIPACTSFECKTDTAATSGKQYVAQRNATVNATSVPACNSLGCKTDTAADSGKQWIAQRNTTANATTTSVPACNSLGCKTDSAADSGKQWIAQRNATTASIPACNSLGCKKGTAEDSGEAYLAQSIPACNSLGCKKGTAEDSGEAYLAQKPVQSHNIQVENEVHQQSTPTCTSVGCYTETAAPHKPGPEDKWPKNYAVANFGVDRDILATFKHTQEQEAKYGKWTPLLNAEKAEKHPVDYPVPNYGMDHEIATSLKNLKHQEGIHGAWNVIQTQNEVNIKDDPICNSAGCTQYLHPHKDGHPKDYFVPDFGLDADIVNSQAHEKAAEGTVNHKWVPKWDEEDEKFKDMPTATAEFKLTGVQQDLRMAKDMEAINQSLKNAQVTLGKTWNPDKDDDGKWIATSQVKDKKLVGQKADIRIKSDPICSSAGCPEHEDEKKKHVLYPVDVPLDDDIKSTKQHTKDQEKIHGIWNPKWEDVQLGASTNSQSNIQLVSENKAQQKTATKSAQKQKAKVEAKSATKNKSKTHAKMSAQMMTKMEKVKDFAQLRESMMSNWGTK